MRDRYITQENDKEDRRPINDSYLGKNLHFILLFLREIKRDCEKDLMGFGFHFRI